MNAGLGLRLVLAFRGVARRDEALRREEPFLRLADFLPLEVLFLPALRAFLRAAAMRALRLEVLFFFLAVFFFFAVFFLRALAIVFSFEFEGFVRFLRSTFLFYFSRF